MQAVRTDAPVGRRTNVRPGCDGSEAVGLRDTRKPGHCWQDNELYDCYQPLIGVYGMALYANLSRHAYYGVVIAYTLRDLAQKTGMSRATAWRTLAVLECLGMVRLRRGCGSAGGELELVDLKDLAAEQGAAPIQNGKSHSFAPAQMEQLRARCEAVRAELGGKAGEVCVSVRDATGDVCVSPRDACVLPERRLRTTRETQTGCIKGSKTQDKKTKPTPTPPGAGGERAEDSGSWVERETERVATAIRVRTSGVRRAIREQLRMHAGSEEEGVGVARRMIESLQAYRADAALLRYTWRPRTFFAEGHWAHPTSWPYQAAQGAARLPQPGAMRPQPVGELLDAVLQRHGCDCEGDDERMVTVAVGAGTIPAEAAQAVRKRLREIRAVRERMALRAKAGGRR